MKPSQLHEIYYFNFDVILKSPINMLLTFTLVPVATYFISIPKALLALGIVFLLDFISGVRASWVEYLKQKDTDPNFVLKSYFIESVKLRKSITKAIAYIILILGSYAIEQIFLIKEIDVQVSHAKFTLSIIATLICFSIELFSIFENLKRLGYDLLGNITSSVKKAWRFFRLVKDGEENN
jgi:hypothetical protein